jgi:hypothetical protein
MPDLERSSRITWQNISQISRRSYRKPSQGSQHSLETKAALVEVEAVTLAVAATLQRRKPLMRSWLTSVSSMNYTTSGSRTWARM